MHVEECCQALLCQILPEIDQERSGIAIDIGVGTFAFYCKLFEQLRFKTIAVEPLPTEHLQRLCKKHRIRLVESCISDIDGFVNLYVGSFKDKEDYNLNSMHPDWWGSTASARQVESMSLSKLLDNRDFKAVTCIKMDVEGLELSIIQQLSGLDKSSLPKVLMFEYGGGGTQDSKKGGWSEEFIDKTIRCLEILRDLGYGQAILVDSAPNTKEQIFDLQALVLDPTEIFLTQYIYGNIIALHKEQYSSHKIASVCERYRNNEIKPPVLKVPESLLRKSSRKVRQVLNRNVEYLSRSRI